mmetsp:Transcript_85773/g.165127  ORF Transcript_85773/g.165127 Transcript_85773/m.165127 type:complete len:279 (+) Transcript_85773:2-838(+)
MLEAQTQTVNIDRDCDATRLFLRFLYVGRFSANDFSTFQVFFDSAYLSDFYGVGEKFAAAFNHHESFHAWVTSWKSFVKNNSMDTAMATCKTCSRLSSCSEKVISTMFENLSITLGSNLFSTLCHARAHGIGDLARRLSGRFAWPSTPVSAWLEQEVNEPALKSFMERFPDQPDLLRLALLDFIGLATAVGRATAPQDAVIRRGNEIETFSGQQFVLRQISSVVLSDLSFSTTSVGGPCPSYQAGDGKHWSKKSVEAFCRRTPDMIKSVENAMANVGN